MSISIPLEPYENLTVNARIDKWNLESQRHAERFAEWGASMDFHKARVERDPSVCHLESMRQHQQARAVDLKNEIEYLKEIFSELPPLLAEGRARNLRLVKEDYAQLLGEIEDGLEKIGFERPNGVNKPWCVYRLLTTSTIHAGLFAARIKVRDAETLAKQPANVGGIEHQLKKLEADLARLIAP